MMSKIFTNQHDVADSFQGGVIENKHTKCHDSAWLTGTFTVTPQVLIRVQALALVSPMQRASVESSFSTTLLGSSRLVHGGDFWIRSHPDISLSVTIGDSESVEVSSCMLTGWELSAFGCDWWRLGWKTEVWGVATRFAEYEKAHGGL